MSSPFVIEEQSNASSASAAKTSAPPAAKGRSWIGMAVIGVAIAALVIGLIVLVMRGNSSDGFITNPVRSDTGGWVRDEIDKLTQIQEDYLASTQK